jgi:signal transduction histidine kinase
MSNKEPFQDRLDDLFSDSDLPEPDPDANGSAAVDAKTNADVGSGEVEEQISLAEQLGSVDLSAVESIRDRVGWDDFLNAIDRSEEFGFLFDQENVSPLDGAGELVDEGQALEVPLQIGDEILGALQLEGAEELPEEAAELMNSIAQQVTQHVENLRLLAQAEQYRTEAEKAARRLTHEGWQEYLDSTIAPEASYLYDKKQVQPVDVQQLQSMVDGEALSDYGLTVRGESIGKIVVADPADDVEKYTELISTVTNRLSGHIENLRLLDESEFSRQQLDKRAAELETVAKVSTAAATILEPQALLQSVVELTAYSFDLYQTTVYLLSEDGKSLEFAAGTGNVGKILLMEGHSFSIDQKKSAIAKAARSREIVIVSDARTDKTFLNHKLIPDTLSEMAMPMIVADELVGVFNVEADEVERFKEEDILTFSTLASQTGVALRNAQLYAEQMETVERLRELDELKSSFLANMSHELRTPLNSILGFTQVIMEGLDGPLTEDMETDLNLIHDSGQHLLALINDVLDMAKIESGKLSLSLEPIVLSEMLDGVLQTIEPLADEKSLELKLESTLDAGMTIMADSVRLRQIVTNLVGNAIKFTDIGGITVSSQQIDKNVLISVTDTGIGIPEDKLESIFEAFSQVDTSTTRKAGGTGLGLPISRQLVEMHGGRLWAESRGAEGEGSILQLELPIEAAAKAPDGILMDY